MSVLGKLEANDGEAAEIARLITHEETTLSELAS